MAVKATVDNTLQFRGYNTIKMVADSRFRTYPYTVSGMPKISHSFWLYAPSNITSAIRARTRFIGANGITLSVVNHSFGVISGAFAEFKMEGVTVPANAKLAVLEFMNPAGSATYWATMPKSEAGEMATAYTANFTGQMTYLTPTGGYIGTLGTNQVIVAGAERLDTRLVTINNSLINLSSSVGSHASTLTTHSNTLTSQGNTITSIQNTQSSHNTRITNNTTNISSLGVRVTNVETVNGQQATTITNIQAGQITLSTSTQGSLAGMTLDSNSLTFSSSGSYFRIMAAGTNDYLRAGTSASDIKFKVTYNGDLYAENAYIKGTIQTGSIINGQLNSTTGTHTGTSTGTHSGTVTGTLSNTSGTHTGNINSGGTFKGAASGVTGTFGSVSGTKWSGQTSGSHSGSVYSTAGQLGGLAYEGAGGTTLRFKGTVFGNNFNAVTGYISCGGNLTKGGNLYYSGSLIKQSDIHYKKNITAIDRESILGGVYNLELVNFDYKEGDKPRQMGVISNDVVSNLPSEFTRYTIYPNEDGYLMADYTTIGLAAIVAVQDLNKRLMALEEKLA